MTESMVKSLRETYRRRITQDNFNKLHGITPEMAMSNVKKLEDVDLKILEKMVALSVKHVQKMHK